MRALAVLLLGCLSAAPAAAAEIQVWSAGAVAAGLDGLLEPFRRETGHVARLTVAVPAVLRQRVESGEVPDVLIAPPAVIDALAQAGKVRNEGRAPVGKVGVGVVVRKGAERPDISSVERFTQAVLGADSLVYNRASTGIYFERLLERLGIAAQVQARTVRYPDGAAVMEHMLKATDKAIGIGPLTEIKPYEAGGVELVGPLPREIQNYTTYEAAIPTGAAAADIGASFVRFVTRPAAKATFSATGVD